KNFLRKKKVKQFLRIDKSTTFEIEDKFNINPYEQFSNDESNDLLIRELSKLPEKQREVFSLRYFDDLSYNEISALLGTTVGGLKANYFHAVKKLSEKLGELN